MMRLAQMLKLYLSVTEGMSQKRVADETGVSETTISRFLSGERLPDVPAFLALQAWCCGTHTPIDPQLAERVAKLEAEMEAAQSTLLAARMHTLPLGGSGGRRP